MKTCGLQNISKSYDFNDYKNLVIKYAEEYKTSGEQLIERIDATLINAQRIKRINKQCIINNKLQLLISQIYKKQKWVLITESWCGDGAQCIPVIAKMAELNDNIKLEIIFRDENPVFMDDFLTNGSRSIPKLICLNKSNHVINFVWGPRPMAIQDKVIELKINTPTITHEDLVKNIHLWYAKDKTVSIQDDFTNLLSKINL